MSDIDILTTLIELLDALENKTIDSSVPHRVREINNNIKYYIERLTYNAEYGKINEFLYDFRFHFLSLFRILEFEIAYIIEKYVIKSDYPHLYPEVREIDHNEIVALGEKAICKVSVVLLAYNNLEYTKECVESILENTHGVEYELILVDNGSTDGTKEYFDSIEGAKVIHLKENLHIVKGFNIGLMAAEGKYCAAVCNDFIFAPNWLNNLILCIESDPSYGFVSPGATSISNLQQINIKFDSKEDFIEKAAEFNKSDPSKWEERVVLLPNVLCCPTALLDQIGYYDTRFFRGEFLDDDISFKIRRSGYKLIYCSDTVTYHVGSLTTASDHLLNSLEEGRKTFIEKYKLDAWTDARINPVNSYAISNNLTSADSILGIDVKCGATVLQIKNGIWSKYRKKPLLSIGTSEEKYKVDVDSIADQYFTFSDFSEISKQGFSDVELIYIEKPLDLYNEDLETIFTSLSNVMKTNGKIIFTVNNIISIENLFKMLLSKESMHNRKIYIQDKLREIAIQQGFSDISVINIVPERSNESNQKVMEIVSSLAGGKQSNREYIESMLLADYFLYEMNYQGK
ncbi:glycosyltransferase family 2 protein [Neobacillus sp. K501]